MVNYNLTFTKQAIKDLKSLKKSDVNAYNKAQSLLHEIKDDPYNGTGKPESLKGVNNKVWSRRISKKHRLVYVIENNELIVEVIQAMGHYDDH